MTGVCETYAIDVNTSRPVKPTAHSPSWPSGLLSIIISSSIVIIIICGFRGSEHFRNFGEEGGGKCPEEKVERQSIFQGPSSLGD
jgi:hypothetical protein